MARMELNEEEAKRLEESFDPEAVPLLPASPRRAPASTGGIFSGVDALFDLNLRRYVTPVLLRFYWWMTLCVASLMLLLFVFTQFTDGSFIGEVTGAPAWSDFSPDASRGGSKDSKFVEAVGTILGTITKWAVRFYVVAVMVLSIRVGLELTMVFFNIANSLTRVEQSVAVLSDSRE